MPVPVMDCAEILHLDVLLLDSKLLIAMTNDQGDCCIHTAPWLWNKPYGLD